MNSFIANSYSILEILSYLVASFSLKTYRGLLLSIPNSLHQLSVELTSDIVTSKILQMQNRDTILRIH